MIFLLEDRQLKKEGEGGFERAENMRVGEEVLDANTFCVLISNITNNFSQRHVGIQYVNLQQK